MVPSGMVCDCCLKLICNSPHLQVNTSELAFDKLGHEAISTHYVSSVLKILYPDAVKHNNYSKTLTSVAFAGTFVGMLIFGWISDKIGRKFGMVRTTSSTSDTHLRVVLSLLRCSLLESLLSFLASLRRRPALTIVPPASLPCSVHVGKSADDVNRLWAANPMSAEYSFLLGIGVGAEYPCGSVAASEQSEEEGIAKNAQHRWFALATSAKPSLAFSWRYLRYYPRHHDRLWFRHFFICAIGSVLDVGVSLFTFWEYQYLLFGLHRFGKNHLRAVWRLSLGLGVIPALAVLIWRLNMQNPSHYRKNSMRDTKIPYWLVIRRYWVNLLAISLTWFIYDFITCVYFRIYIIVRYSG